MSQSLINCFLLRAIEYTIYKMEIDEVGKKCDKLARERERINVAQNEVESDLLDTKDSLQQMEREVHKLEHQFRGMSDERTALLNERAEVNGRKTEIELAIEDLTEDVVRECADRVSSYL